MKPNKEQHTEIIFVYSCLLLWGMVLMLVIYMMDK